MSKKYYVISEREATRCANNGARLLDELRPGWAEDVDTEQLDLGDCCKCVLGQLYGDYCLAIDSPQFRPLFGYETGQGSIQRFEHGFSLSNDYHERELSWRQLTQAWVDQIRMRKGGAA